MMASSMYCDYKPGKFVDLLVVDFRIENTPVHWALFSSDPEILFSGTAHVYMEQYLSN
ncbi:hypothetical protein QNI22_34925 [Cytophagaceae bacterium BD1B2-1]|uniref:Uncharacterized protein n=1 Tax=Xanthocytophaga agilis TaxID=3048010 RepID=A0AAE3R8Y0_9BACT|nr:hypothetical protein [Xanthocytophaga agilis]